ncbi:hypothetical protein ACFSR6_03330 [Pedobacter vanadiisoli]|uniref:Uncharacterized protein n=1 Tax=Pedobacter vanadiisoli TaxID=1761975 RepID=A0ABW5MGJ1_9SPHI
MDTAIFKIVAQEPESVAQLFNLYGYDMPVTPRNLQNLLKRYGTEPLPFSDATGDEKPKKSFAEIMNMIASGTQTLAKVISAVKGNSTNIVNGQNVNVSLDGRPTGATDRVLGIDRKLFIVLALVLLILLGVLLFRKKQ